MQMDRVHQAVTRIRMALVNRTEEKETNNLVKAILIKEMMVKEASSKLRKTIITKETSTPALNRVKNLIVMISKNKLWLGQNQIKLRQN